MIRTLCIPSAKYHVYPPPNRITNVCLRSKQHLKMPLLKATIRHNSGPTAVSKIRTLRRAQTGTQPSIEEEPNPQQTFTQQRALGPSMPVPKPHAHPHLEINTHFNRKKRKLRQPYREPQAPPTPLYYYVHEVDGTHTWRTGGQIKAMREEGMEGQWHNDQRSGFVFFWRKRREEEWGSVQEPKRGSVFGGVEG